MNSLAGRTIVLLESRQLDLMAGMIEEQGGKIIRCPLVAIVDSPDRAAVLQWVDDLVLTRFDDVIFYTGEGIRRLLTAADSAGKRDSFIDALKRVRKISRGPKPVRALREIGLESDIVTEPTSAGIVAALAGVALAGRTIGVQTYGEFANDAVDGFLAKSGAIIRTVAPYRYSVSTDDAVVAALIEKLAAGAIDAIAFTSSSQLERLEKIAAERHWEPALRRGLDRVLVAAIGPVMAASLKDRGFRVDAMPERSFTLKPLLRAMTAALQNK